jgi:hypothetical protein
VAVDQRLQIMKKNKRNVVAFHNVV